MLNGPSRGRKSIGRRARKLSCRGGNRNRRETRARNPFGCPRDRRTEEMVEKVPMTAGGYAALGVELKKRQSEDRPRIIEHIAEARSHGDLSENAEYHAAKEEQSHN